MPEFVFDHTLTPYARALKTFAAKMRGSFMVPGHGNDATAGGAHLAEFFSPELLAIDLPMLLRGIDAESDSALEHSRALAADAWGAKRTWFLTGGASQGNRTAAIAVRGLGKRVLIQRSSHSSFSDGTLLADLLPSYVLPSVDVQRGIAHGITPEMLEAALRRDEAAGSPAASVYIVSPSYFGSVSDVAALSDICHAHGAALIVDNAWGAHFGFHSELPESPLRQGADLVISSTHKLAASLTQSAMLHLGDGPFVERLTPLVDRAWQMTSSTSTSALLLASLDLARRALMVEKERIAEALRAAARLRDWVNSSDSYTLAETGFDRFPDVVATDPLRITIDTGRLELTGHGVREKLADEYGLHVEMSTAGTIVIVIGALAKPRIELLTAALTEIALQHEDAGRGGAQVFPPLSEPGETVMTPRKAFFGASEIVPAAQAVGRVSADALAAYPPGIPNLLPGETITTQTLNFLQAVASTPSGYVRGAVDPLVQTVRVVK